MTDPNHPIWSLLKLGLVLTWSGIVLYVTATDFDATELRAIIGLAMGWGAAEVGDLARLRH